MIDTFGNYLCQKLINIASQSQLEKILRYIQTQLFKIAINNHGTRPLQILLQRLYFDEKISELIFKSLHSRVVDLCLNIHGNHVIQTIISKSTHKYQFALLEPIQKSWLTICENKHGCCVLQFVFSPKIE